MSSAPSTQDRLLDAVAEVSSRDGYPALTVERVLVCAGVSRATFYQYHASVEDLFWSAYRLHAERLVSTIAAHTGRPGSGPRAVLRALAQEASERPVSAALLMSECLAATPTGLLERDALIARLIAASGGEAPIDLPMETLVGGAMRFLSMWLADPALAEDPAAALEAWLARFTGPGSGRRAWRETVALPPSGAPVPRPARLPRPRGSARERIVAATTAGVYEVGYRTLTVAGIVQRAGCSRRLFYNEFASKRAAFIAAYESGFQRTFAACAPAFFLSQTWPDRVWDSAVAFTSFLAAEPATGYLGFVECYALGREFSERVRETQLAFTLFLEEGYRQGPEGRTATRATAALTAATIAEIASRAARASPGLYIRRMMPLAVYVALAPFIGSDLAGSYVLERLADGVRGPAPVVAARARV